MKQIEREVEEIKNQTTKGIYLMIQRDVEFGGYDLDTAIQNYFEDCESRDKAYELYMSFGGLK